MVEFKTAVEAVMVFKRKSMGQERVGGEQERRRQAPWR